jgi:hypothetical protein
MKVSEMIELLKKLPQDLPVYIVDRWDYEEFEPPSGGVEYLIRDKDVNRPRRVEL